jgi:hypothetical protein
VVGPRGHIQGEPWAALPAHEPGILTKASLATHGATGRLRYKNPFDIGRSDDFEIRVFAGADEDRWRVMEGRRPESKPLLQLPQPSVDPGRAPLPCRWLRFDGSRLAEDRASCYVQQRRPDLAEPILLELLKRHPSGRRRGIALADLAAVSAQRPDALRLVTYGAAALDHTRQTGSGVVLRKLQNLRPELARFKKDPHVRNLDTEIAHLVVSSH